MIVALILFFFSFLDEISWISPFRLRVRWGFIILNRWTVKQKTGTSKMRTRIVLERRFDLLLVWHIPMGRFLVTLKKKRLFRIVGLKG